MIGNLDVARHRLGARRRVRKHAGQQIVRARALDLRRDSLALLHAQQLQRAPSSPAPAILEQRRRDRRLLQQLLRGELREEVEDIAQRKAVLLGERDVDAVIGCRGLQFKVEAAAEALAQRESPGLVQPSAERCMQDELLAAALVEEAFGDDRGLGRHGAQHGAPADNVGDQLQRGRVAHEALAPEPGDALGHLGVRRVDRAWRNIARALVNRRAQIADTIAQHGGALRSFALPERNARRRSMRILNQHLARGIDALNAPAGIAQQNDVAG